MVDEHHDHHQMDTNGFTGHDKLLVTAEKRFISAALAYAGHVASGDHAACTDPDQCHYHLGLMDAHKVLVTAA